VANTHEAALAMREKLRAEIHAHVGRTVDEALREYLAALAASGTVTREKIVYTLRRFLPLDEPLSALSPDRAERLYLAETQRTKKNGKLIAADSHHLFLRRAKHFYKWAVGRRYVEHNPFAEVRPIGRPRRGKPQLRIDEARRVVACALEHARHSLRGLNATLALEAGATAHHVAAALGHASFSITARHYADASTVANANLRKVADVLTSQSPQSLGVPELARLLRESLPLDQLRSLHAALLV
jgi:site-specific recombinase XerD